MSKLLHVYLHSNLVGELEQNKSGMMFFRYNETWLNKKDAMSLSQSLPLRKEPFKRNECRGFFAGILPEEENRHIIAKNLGISAANDFAMLERIGGECAGAITFLPPGFAIEKHNDQYLSLSDKEFVNIIKELPKRPLMAGQRGVRLSLAGAQDKIAVTIKDEQIMLPIGGAPSTHIIKPIIDRYHNIVHNEQFCLTLAKAIGLPTADSYILSISDIECLVITRYDRKIDKQGNLIRIHQEDFCQALGISPEIKYQSEGGPSLTDCFNLIRNASTIPVIDISRLLNAVIFNYLIGNNDAHAKNFSLLYFRENNHLEVRFAPLYDLISTSTYPELSINMAMKIGDKYNSNEVTTIDWERFATASGLAVPLVKKQISEIAKKILRYINTYQDKAKIVELLSIIESRCKKIVDRAT